MKKKTWFIIAAILVIIAGGVFTLLRLTGGSHTAIDRAPEPEVSGNSNVLVAYFSWSGNGQQMADWIAEETGGDLFRILTEEPYGDDFDSTASRAQTELNNETRPALSTHIDPEVMAGYDVIYLGFRFGGTTCQHRSGVFWRNTIYPEKTLSHFFLPQRKLQWSKQLKPYCRAGTGGNRADR